jgi:pimeloyl-ACP methyl ester carboxylesterase
MSVWLHSICMLVVGGTAPVETRCVQVAPAPAKAPEDAIMRSLGQSRAVVLIEGLRLHLLRQDAAKPDLRHWQQPGSVLVRALARDADVFAFTYGQRAPVTEIADVPALATTVRRLREAGYREIVLIGFSAGGIVARQFIEDYPSAGVARVIQVCAPNVGSPLANMHVGVAPVQKVFLQSLTSKARVAVLEDRRDKRIPADVEFLCVVGNGLIYSDGVVPTHSQWPDDLQAQGVPAVVIATEHWFAVRGERAAQQIARLAHEHQPRWDGVQSAAMRKRLFGDKASPP